MHMWNNVAIYKVKCGDFLMLW